jgi:tRNA pseudouridine(38-40) synthase
MSLRRGDGFRRYALSVQYHGASFLGFSQHGSQEDCILPNGTDLRGYRSVEGRIREALNDMFPDSWENMKVSSRTDRGVHALKNTFHVDVHGENEQGQERILRKLRNGLNNFLAMQTTTWSKNHDSISRKERRKKNRRFDFAMFEEDDWRRHSVSDELRILSAKSAPDLMDNPRGIEFGQPAEVDWNARFSATQRTYIYRILSFAGMDSEWGVPFEWDTSWRIRGNGSPLDTVAMQKAAHILEGTHDFSSFRGAKCQRSLPVVHMDAIRVNSCPYGPPALWGMDQAGLLSLGKGESSVSPQLITVSVVGNSFLYRQVRNMVGVLVEVGRRRLKPGDVEELLHARDRRLAPGMAPPQGLFLVDVQHGDFHF